MLVQTALRVCTVSTITKKTLSFAPLEPSVMLLELWKLVLKTLQLLVNNARLDTTALMKESGRLLITSALQALTLLLALKSVSLAKLEEIVGLLEQLKLSTRVTQVIAWVKSVKLQLM